MIKNKNFWLKIYAEIQYFGKAYYQTKNFLDIYSCDLERRK